MPPLDDNIEDLEPSADPNLDETAAAPSAKQSPDAASSTAAEGENSDDGLLSVVRDVVAESRKTAPEAASPAEDEEVSDEAGTQKKPDDEDYSDVPFHKHPRFQQLLRKSKAFEQDATRYRNVQEFMDQQGLTAEEAADGLSIMGLAKINPSEAWQRIKPWVQKVLVAAGEVLADDLQTKVQSGEMSRETALELSRARAAAQNATAVQSFREQRAQRQQQTETMTSLQSAAQNWEDERRLKDPNFRDKEEAIRITVAGLIQTEGMPQSPQGVRAQLKKAYDMVSARIPAAAPAPTPQRKPAIRPVTGGQVSGGQPQPAARGELSTLDIIRANRRAS